jgi:hypothetical protein
MRVDAAGRAGAPVLALEQRHAQAAQRGVPRDAGAVDAAADDGQVVGQAAVWAPPGWGSQAAAAEAPDHGGWWWAHAIGGSLALASVFVAMRSVLLARILAGAGGLVLLGGLLAFDTINWLADAHAGAAGGADPGGDAVPGPDADAGGGRPAPQGPGRGSGRPARASGFGRRSPARLRPHTSS